MAKKENKNKGEKELADNKSVKEKEINKEPNEVKADDIDSQSSTESEIEGKIEVDIASEEDGGCEEKDQEIKDWKNDYDELYEKYIRLYSEFDNFRRRTNKEKLDIIERANESLIIDFLEILDDFERANRSFEEVNEGKEVKDGVMLIYNKFKKSLEDKGVKEIDCIGKEFDPEIHEAITKIPAPKKKLKGKVVDQIQKGYFLKDTVIRHSKVVVGE